MARTAKLRTPPRGNKHGSASTQRMLQDLAATDISVPMPRAVVAKPLEGKTPSQKRYMKAIATKQITIGVGYAGTGKTYIAGAMAAMALQDGLVDQIVITRPAVEAGEKLGFLPGEKEDKYEPYIAAFMGVLNERLGKGKVEYLLKQGKIIGAPLAYMRGHAEPLTAVIPTPSGPVLMGDLKVGDKIYGSDGKPTIVTGVFPQGIKPVVDVTFADGSVVRCSRDHLWNTRTPSQRVRGTAYSTKSAAVIQTSVLNKHGQKNHEIPVISAPIEMSARDVPVDPYLLGALIGDGTISSGSIHFCSTDQELIQSFRDRLPSSVSIKANSSSKTGYDYYITNTDGSSKPNVLKDALRSLGCWGMTASEKSVPEIYLNNDVNVRLQVLRGLMDTDGSVFSHRSGKSRVEFYSTSVQLAKDVKYLVESLGGIATHRSKTGCAGISPATGIPLVCNFPMQVVNIVLPPTVNPFLLSRKAEKFKPSPMMRLITSVVDAGEEEVQCVSVAAADSLYLTGNFIVTHNTFKRAFVIMDEAQNATPVQMKLFLTRIGEDSIVVVNGDTDQVDIPGASGLTDAIKKISFIPSVSVVEFGLDDVVRSSICSEIVRAYAQPLT